MIREILEKIVDNGFKNLQKYIVKKENKNDKLLIYVNFEDADAVDKIIADDKLLTKSLNVKDSTGKYKTYYFDMLGEADGSYGDLGVVPTAPSNLGNKEDPRKKKSLFIVDGEVREEEK